MATSMEENGRNVTYIAVGGRSHERLFTFVDVWLNFHPWKFPCKKFAENFVAVSLEVEKNVHGSKLGKHCVEDRPPAHASS